MKHTYTPAPIDTGSVELPAELTALTEKLAENTGCNFEVLNPLGDSNGDGRIDSVDASQIMDLYSRISTMSAIADAKDIAEQDVNGDGRIDSVDASTVLSYYTYLAANGEMSLKEFIAAEK